MQSIDPNPYAAPKAVVADPVLVQVERPRVVTRAVQLLSIYWVLLLVLSLDRPDRAHGGTWMGQGITYGLMFAPKAWFIFELARGRRWARMAYVVFALIFYGALASYLAAHLAKVKEEPITAVLVAGGLLAELFASYLLFTKRASRWFAEPMRLARP